MLRNRQAIFSRFWQSAQLKRLVITSAASIESSLHFQQLQELRLSRDFATLSDNQSPSDNTHEFAELRSYLENATRQTAGPARVEGEATELPIGGGVMPELPRTDTDVSRLLGRRGNETLRSIRHDVKSGGLGQAVNVAIQQHQLTAPKRGATSGLNASEEVQDLLERWDDLLRMGDYNSLTQQMQARPKDIAKITATFQAADNARKEAAEKRMRQQREADIKAAIAASHVVVQDEFGRSYGTGKRKTSIARVWISPTPEEREGMGRILVNGKRFFDYFGPVLTRTELVKPFEATGTLGLFDVKANVTGGGFTGQAQAIRHGISRALSNFAPELRPALKAEGYLTRDTRIVERKKPGRKKARRAFQWVKR